MLVLGIPVRKYPRPMELMLMLHNRGNINREQLTRALPATISATSPHPINAALYINIRLFWIRRHLQYRCGSQFMVYIWTILPFSYVSGPPSVVIDCSPPTYWAFPCIEPMEIVRPLICLHSPSIATSQIIGSGFRLLQRDSRLRL